jgi:hypothetical protein
MSVEVSSRPPNFRGAGHMDPAPAAAGRAVKPPPARLA